MRDIYLIDFENVASEGLSGITYLSEDDQVIIFYSNNSNRLTMKMHILIGKSVCQLSYFEVTVGGKNALDHQISTWLGYLIGTGAAERNYYIVSRDMGYKHVANFWGANRIGPKVRCIDAIKGASRLERNNRRDTVLQAMPQQSELETVQTEAAEAPVSEAPEVTTAETPTMEVTAAPAEETNSTVESLLPEALEAQPEPEKPADVLLPAVPEVSELSTETAEAAVEVTTAASAEAAAVSPTETAEKEEEPAPQKRTYRSRTRVRSRTRSKKEHTEAPAPQEAASVSSVCAAAAQESTPQPEAPTEEKHHPAKTTKSSQTKNKPSKKDEQKPSVNLDQLSAMIAPYPKLQESVLRDLIANNKRQVLCNTLRKHLGQEKGLALYNEIKKSAWH